jgi:hypothetical protein
VPTSFWLMPDWAYKRVERNVACALYKSVRTCGADKSDTRLDKFSVRLCKFEAGPGEFQRGLALNWSCLTLNQSGLALD